MIQQRESADDRPAVPTYPVTVGQVMTTGVLTVRPSATFHEIVALLLDYEISGLPVVDADGALIGIVSEADLISKEAYAGDEARHGHLKLLRDHLHGHDTTWVHKAAARNARELMTSPVRTVSPEDDLSVAARIMLTEHVKRLPVVSDGKLVGMLARHDLLRPLVGAD